MRMIQCLLFGFYKSKITAARENNAIIHVY